MIRSALPSPLWLRISLIILALLLLLWLPLEGNQEWPAILLAAMSCALPAARVGLGVLPQAKRSLLYHALLGALAGLLVIPVAIFFMVFKNGLHAHPTPDFTLGQIRAVLRLAPVWIASGLLLGVGAWMWRLVRST